TNSFEKEASGKTPLRFRRAAISSLSNGLSTPKVNSLASLLKRVFFSASTMAPRRSPCAGVKRNCQFKIRLRTRAGVILRARAMSYSGASGSIAPASIRLANTNRSISVFERVPKAGDIYAAINAPVNFAAFAGFDNAALISIAMPSTPIQEPPPPIVGQGRTWVNRTRAADPPHGAALNLEVAGFGTDRE